MERFEDRRFETLIMPHLHPLYQAALRLTGTRAQAEELVHEVCDCAWASIGRRKPWTNGRLQLFKILMQRLRHRNGAAKPYPGEEVAAMETETPVPFSRSSEDVIAALNQLPLVLRQILLLVDGFDFSYREAAGILDLPETRVADYLSRGRTLLIIRDQTSAPELSTSPK